MITTIIDSFQDQYPTLSAAVRVRAAIYCAQAVLEPGTVPEWDAWAEAWLRGERTAEAARAASLASWEVAWTSVAARAADAAAALMGSPSWWPEGEAEVCAAEEATRVMALAAWVLGNALDLPIIIRKAIVAERQ